MIVTAAAADGQAKEHRAGRLDAIDDIADITSSSMEPPSLVVTWQRLKPVATADRASAFGSRSPANLFDDELIVGLVAVERLDDPIAEGPISR